MEGQSDVNQSGWNIESAKNGRLSRPFTFFRGCLAEEEQPTAAAAENFLPSAADPLLLVSWQGHPATLAETPLHLRDRQATFGLSQSLVFLQA